jgi:hypothetical protein
VIPLLVVVSAALAAFSFLCWKLSRMHSYAAALSQCIAQMLCDPDRVEQIADATREDLIARGLWRSK